MGVHGLWKLIEPAGKPVPLETLENKVLAVDVSIWLHQLVKGFQDSRGSSVPNAHLLGIFHRVCKLLYYRIKPIFVFDGGVPILKKQTIAARKQQRNKATQDAARIREQLLKNLIKTKAVRQVLGEKPSKEDVSDDRPREDADMFKLPPMEDQGLDSESESEPDLRSNPNNYMSDSDSESDCEVKVISPIKLHKLDLHSLDVTSEQFLSLPPDVRHDILSDLQETRKQNSWGRLHEMPEESGDFSSFQIGRLLKRRNVQVSMEQAEKEMGGKVLSLNELHDLMTAQGVEVPTEKTTEVIDSSARRIASDASTRYLLLKGPINEKGCTSQQEVISSEVAESKENIRTIKSEPLEDDLPEVYQDNWSSDDEDALLKTDNVIAQTMIENSELSQEQILAIIKNQIKAEEVSDSDDTFDNIPGTSKAALEKLRKTNCDPASPVIDVASSSTSTCSPTVKTSNSRNTVHLSSNESDSDEFQEVPFKTTASSSSRNSSKLLVVGEKPAKIEKSKKLQGDIFSDVFSKSSTPGSTKKSSALEETIEVVIPSGKLDKIEDDIFSDIFSKPSATGSDSKSTAPKKTIEIVVPSGKPKAIEDIFSDIFPSKPQINTVPSEPLEVVISPKNLEKLEDDIFADVFSNPQFANRGEKEKSVHKELEESLPKHANSTSNIYASIVSSIKKSQIQEELLPSSRGSSPKQNSAEVTKGKNIEVIEGVMEENDLGVEDNSENEESDVEDSAPTSSTSETREEKSDSLPLSTSELQLMESSLEEQQRNLQMERGRQERLAASITEQMCTEAQELLQLFGVPYVVAPMEAEAQCAFLDAVSLTEGTITDDSDIWLFGGRKVYKNFFNQKKHVLQYTHTNIQHYFKLSREQLIQLALLVGSDYTTGLQGIGPVTALEILAAFPSDSSPNDIETTLRSLSRFRDWWVAGQPHRSARTQQLKNKLKDVKFFDGFPSKAVVEAYLRPAVDESRETFSWGALDLPALREFTRQKFGWTTAKVDEIIGPVAKRWTGRTSQRTIDSFFNFKPVLVEGLNKMSKRVQKAVRNMGESENSDDADDPEIESTKSKIEGKRKSSKARTEKSAVKRARTDRSKIKSHSNEGTEQMGQESGEEHTHDLPVRAPTVPRERTHVGIKRTGAKTSKPSVKASNLNTGNTDEQVLEQLLEQDLEQAAGRGVKEESHNLPVRAPIFPRQRTHMGVKRVGAKRAEPTVKQRQQTVEDTDHVDQLHERRGEEAIHKVVRTATATNPNQTTHVFLKKISANATIVSTRKKSVSDDSDQSTDRHPKATTSQSKAKINKVTTGSNPVVKKTASKRKVSALCPSREYDHQSDQEFSDVDTTADFDRIENQSSKLDVQPSVSGISRPARSSTVRPSYSPASSEEDTALPPEAAVELASLSASVWEDDPWEDEMSQFSKVPEQQPKKKIYFGGIRRNKPKKSATVAQNQPVSSRQAGVDDRGVRPGWRTEEQLQSRSALWVDALHNKPTEQIPQRKQDCQAQEQAKNKAIQVLKASGALQASRILGGTSKGSKQRRGKKKLVRKELPEHNLSESSSDE